MTNEELLRTMMRIADATAVSDIEVWTHRIQGDDGRWWYETEHPDLDLEGPEIVEDVRLAVAYLDARGLIDKHPGGTVAFVPDISERWRSDPLPVV